MIQIVLALHAFLIRQQRLVAAAVLALGVSRVFGADGGVDASSPAPGAPWLASLTMWSSSLLGVALAVGGWNLCRTRRSGVQRSVGAIAVIAGFTAAVLAMALPSRLWGIDGALLLIVSFALNIAAWSMVLGFASKGPTASVGTNEPLQDEDALWAARLSYCEAEAMAVVDRTGRVRWTNRKFEQLHGVVLEEIRGVNIHEVLSVEPADTPRLEQVLASLSRGDAGEIEAIVSAASGGRYLAKMQYSPILGESGSVVGAVAMVRDVTQLRTMEGELNRRGAEMERLQAAALAANRAKSEFLANVSHEIRTPMTAILGYTELLSEDGDRELAPKSRLEYIDTIKRNGEHLLTIINDILDLSKIEAGRLVIEPVPTDPAVLIREVVNLMQVNAVAKSLKLELQWRGLIPASIRTDPIRLRQILMNLVGNAIKFTELGHISIRVGCDAASSEPGDSVLVVEVSDTGIGMSHGQLAELFGAFVQADTSMTRRFGGTGLGLRVSMNLARLLGGTITVRSEPGQGSTFILSVSTGSLAGVAVLEQSEPVQTREVPAASSASHSRRELCGTRVLLAEDGIDNQRLIAFHLRKAGATVSIFNNGRLALEAMTCDGTVGGALKLPAEFDLVLTDMQMPEMDGYAFASRLRVTMSADAIRPAAMATQANPSSENDSSLRASPSSAPHRLRPVEIGPLIPPSRYPRMPSRCSNRCRRFRGATVASGWPRSSPRPFGRPQRCGLPSGELMAWDSPRRESGEGAGRERGSGDGVEDVSAARPQPTSQNRDVAGTSEPLAASNRVYLNAALPFIKCGRQAPSRSYRDGGIESFFNTQHSHVRHWVRPRNSCPSAFVAQRRPGGPDRRS
ncbi:MAG: ATP-binding protein [Planctomycetota bacterium]|nr:ATP-binding protein [Planctomycetota bacterium]